MSQNFKMMCNCIHELLNVFEDSAQRERTIDKETIQIRMILLIVIPRLRGILLIYTPKARGLRVYMPAKSQAAVV